MASNLIKNVGKFNGISHQMSLDKNWTRRTVYYTSQYMPIFMTKEKKFFTTNLETGRKNYRPKAAYVLRKEYLKPLNNTPLPIKLRRYLNNTPRQTNFKNSNKANLYSKKRNISANNMRKQYENKQRRFKRLENLKSKININRFLVNNPNNVEYIPKNNFSNLIISQNNVNFLKRELQRQINNFLNNNNFNENNKAYYRNNPEKIPNNNLLKYRVIVGQKMVNAEKERKSKISYGIKGLNNRLPRNISRKILNKSGLITLRNKTV